MSRKPRRRYVPSRLRCSVCGSALMIQRPTGQLRGVGHVKDIYCAVCGGVTAHVEDGMHATTRTDELIVALRRAVDKQDSARVEEIARALQRIATGEDAS